MSGKKEEEATMDMTALGPPEFACGPIYALELAMNNHARYVKTRADVLIVWFHWCLLRNGFYFFGGELTHNDFHSETLPPNLGFNGDRRAYVLKYGKGVMPYCVGFYLKGTGADISFISLYRSLRINIDIEDLVDDCLNLQDEVVQQLTMLVDEELIKPMQLENDDCGDDDDDCDNANDDDQNNQRVMECGSTESGIQTDRNQWPQNAQTLIAQQRAQSQLSKTSTREIQADFNAADVSSPQTLLAVSGQSTNPATKPTVVPRPMTPFSRRPDERYRVQRAPSPNRAQQNSESNDREDEGLGKKRGFTGCCG